MSYKLFVGGKYGNSSFQHLGDSKNTIARILSEKSIEVTNSINDATHYLCLDLLQEELREIEQLKIPIEHRILILQEPKVVLPANYSKRNLKKFNKVVRVGRPPKNGSVSLFWPQFWPKIEIEYDFGSRINTGAALMASNHLSLVENELYSLRRRCVYTMPDLYVFGKGWNQKLTSKVKQLLICLRSLLRHPTKISPKSLSHWFSDLNKIVSSPVDKLNTLQEFKINLVIENSAEFLTEKLFDAFFARCIPVYVGPRISDYLIPSHLVVQCEPSVKGIREGIKVAEGMNYQSWLIGLESWLETAETKEIWSAETYISNLIKILLDSIDLDEGQLLPSNQPEHPNG